MKRLIKLDHLYGAQNYSPASVVLNKGKGVYLYDVNNKKYFDFLSAYSSINQGHCHPRLVKLMKKQIEKLTLCSRAFYSENHCKFLEYMNYQFNYDKCLPMNTGVEACETAIKLARLWGYRNKKIKENKAEIVVSKNNFWGRTITACSSSNDPLCYKNFGPFTPGFHIVDYNDINQLEKIFKYNPNIAGFMTEPIQGEAGIIVPDKDYLKKVKKLCIKYNILFICDEVQTGIGRTGKMLVSENIKPDLLILGKALSGGMMPISCVLGNNNVMNLIEPGSHGSTFGGNPLAMKIVPTAIDIIKKENLLENSIKQGKYFRNKLRPLINNGLVKDVRGVGLLNGIEFNNDKQAIHVVNNCLKKGLLTKITKYNTIRMCPPLTISKSEMKEAIDIFKSSILTI